MAKDFWVCEGDFAGILIGAFELFQELVRCDFYQVVGSYHRGLQENIRQIPSAGLGKRRCNLFGRIAVVNESYPVGKEVITEKHDCTVSIPGIIQVSVSVEVI